MKNRIAFIAWLFVFTLLLTACSTTVTSVYLLRHAEKQGGQDPDLTPEGQQRAQELVRVLKNVPVAAVYSTNTNRTRQTAQPLATDHVLRLQFYSTNSVAGTVLSNQKEKTSVVVGHSDTVPGLITAFGGTPPYTHIPLAEYDNLFLLIIEREIRLGSSTKTKTKVLHMKYGTASN